MTGLNSTSPSVNASTLWLASTLTTSAQTSFSTSLFNDTVYSPTKPNTLWDENRRKANSFVFVVVYLALLMISGIIGNCLVCYVYYFRFRLTPANLFIFTLGVLDLASCCIGMPFEICDISYPYMFDAPVACKLLRFAESITIIASAATLICVAFDRYFKICRPFHKFPLRTARILCFASVLLSLFMSWPALVIFGRKSIPTSDPNITGVECTVDDNIRDRVYPTLYYGTLLGVFVIALCIITTLYTLIGRMVWKVKRTTIGEVIDNTRRPSAASLQMAPSSGNVSKEERRGSLDSLSTPAPNSRQAIRAGRTTMIFITVTVIFVLSFLPFLTVTLLKAAKVVFNEFETHQEELIYNVCVRSYFINNSVNPLIYSVMNINFRRECLAIFRRSFEACQALKKIKTLRKSDTSDL